MKESKKYLILGRIAICVSIVVNLLLALYMQTEKGYMSYLSYNIGWGWFLFWSSIMIIILVLTFIGFTKRFTKAWLILATVLPLTSYVLPFLVLVTFGGVGISIFL